MRDPAALRRNAAMTAAGLRTAEREYISTGAEAQTGIQVAVIEAFGDQPREMANSSFLVKLIDDDLQPTGDQFEVYARIQTDATDPIYDLTSCTPTFALGDYIEFRRAQYPIGGEMITGWFAEGTFQSIGCTT